MKRLLTILAAALVLASPAHAGPPPVQARAYLVLNSSTGEVLASRDAQARVPIASITKLMTVLIALERTKLDDVVTVQRDVAAVGESTINLRTGERITVRDLIDGALIQSANDAADALADYVGHGDAARFVAMMNAKARELGLKETHFARPDGLDAPGHVSSAHDVTLLARIAMHNAVIRDTVAMRDATISGHRHLHTWNDLLGSFPGLFGVKTGHTAAAGWCEVAAVHGDGTTIYVTILGSPTRAQRNADLAALLRWGVSRYRVARVITPGRPYAYAQTGYGRAPLPLVSRTPVLRSVRTDRPLVARIVAVAAVALPVHAGEHLGVVRVYSGRRLVGERPLVAARTIARPGAAARASFYARRTLKHAWGWFT